MQQIYDERPLSELFAELSQEARRLISQEIELAKVEMRQKVSQVGRDIAFLAVGAAVAYAGFLAIMAAVIIGLATLIPSWLAALLVGLVVMIAGSAFVLKGQSDLKERDLAPRRSLAVIKENKEWMQEQVT